VSIPVPLPLLADVSTEIGKHLSIGPNPKQGALVGNVLHVDTMLSTLLVAAVLFALAFFVRRRLTSGVPGTLQNLVEYILEFVIDTAKGQIGEKRAQVIAPLAFTLAMFVFLSNFVGLIPTGGLFKSPTADMNTTFALALTVIGYVEVKSFKARKARGFFKHFVTPPLLAPILVVEELSKPITLSLRLFGNIASGEIMLVIVASAPIWLQFILAPTWSFIWVGFSIFVGAVQAFVFVMLTIAYYGIGTDTEGH
jgi:F-type H+-transporting ATPase subunit a